MKALLYCLTGTASLIEYMPNWHILKGSQIGTTSTPVKLTGTQKDRITD